jgi:hypothetical protein
MSFYRDLREGRDSNFSQDEYLEETYQKIYKKIARDFIHIEDFKEIMRDMFSEVLLDLELSLELRRNAFLKAKEYEKNLNKKLSERKGYQDIDEILVKKKDVK